MNEKKLERRQRRDNRIVKVVGIIMIAFMGFFYFYDRGYFDKPAKESWTEIDEVNMWQRVLTNWEIDSLYAGSKDAILIDSVDNGGNRWFDGKILYRLSSSVPFSDSSDGYVGIIYNDSTSNFSISRRWKY